MPTKKKIMEFVGFKLSTDPRWASKALDVVFANQTADEKATATTVVHNDKGFTGVDAEFLTSLAKSKVQYGNLTPAQTKWLLKKMGKYRAQIIESSKRKGRFEELKKMVEVWAANQGGQQ